MQSRGISFVDFVRNSLDKYELGGKLQWIIVKPKI
jgi:hypothetical protein